ncbi:MAG: hypothetical protein J6S29_00975 [Methanosphaera sp.]|nr:hypothetical protein [Methanosphaera sp.]
MIQCTKIFRAHIIDVTPKKITVETTGNPDKITQ